MRIIFIIPLVLVSLVSFSSWGDNPNLQDGMTAADSGDYTTALRHMIPLAEQGLSFAQDKLGYMYQYGIGVSLNIENAAKWYKRAALQGNGNAQTNLGACYSEGVGVQKDYVRAYMWGDIGASNGSKNGGKLRDWLAKKMTSSQISEAKKLIQECKRCISKTIKRDCC